MSTLLDEPFLGKLKITPFDDYKNKSLRDITLGNNAHFLYNDVERLFTLRHIYCHELAPLERVAVKEIIKCFNAVLNFFYVTEFLVMDLLNGPAFFR